MRLCAVFRATLREVLAAEFGDVVVDVFAAAVLAFVAGVLDFVVVGVVVVVVVDVLLLPELGGDEDGPGFIWIILRVRVGGGGRVTGAACVVPVAEPGARRFFPRDVETGADAGSAAARAGGGSVNVSTALDWDCCVAIPWGKSV